MKKHFLFLLPVLLIGLLFLAPQRAAAQEPTATATATQAPPGVFERPLIIVQSYSAGSGVLEFGQEVDVSVFIYNTGQHYAYNVLLTFTPGDLLPRGTGGILSAGEIAPGNHENLSQPFTVSSDLWGKSNATLQLIISYYDEQGTLYSETFNLTFAIKAPRIVYSTLTPTPTATLTPTATPSPTPAPVLRPQLVITHYETSPISLEPGAQFTFSLQIQNMGNSAAKRITMIVGGGSAGSTGSTPEPGGISGGSGEFTNFAPLGSSNIQSLGDLATGEALDASHSMIVNVSTNPGAYPMKISFVYLNENGAVVIDDQVITLLVYRTPKVDISFYQDPGPMFAGQPNMLPLQIVNLGRNSVVLGNMQVTTAGGFLENSIILIGALDTGGYFTLDATLYPDMPGSLDLIVSVDYTDDFSQPQVISRTITLDVQEAPIFEPPVDGENGNGGVEPTPGDEPESLGQVLWRLLLGFLGLDSAKPQSTDGITPLPGEKTPEESPPIVIPAPKG